MKKDEVIPYPQPKLIHIYVLFALDQMREEYALKNAGKK